MKDYIQERVLAIAGYILETGATVREAAKWYKISKSTVHKDMTDRLPRINLGRAGEVKAVLELNKSERHIRGGQATLRKYKG